MNNYKNLIYVLTNNLSYELEFSRDEANSYVKRAINTHRIVDVIELKKELEHALSDTNFNWVEFAYEHKFIWDNLSYSNFDIIQRLFFYIGDIIFPDKTKNEEEIRTLIKFIFNLFKNKDKQNKWIKVKDLYQEIIQHEKYKNLDFFYMYYFIEACGYGMDIKYETGNREEIILIKSICG